MKRFALVRELLGDGDRTEANPGTYHNVLIESGPAAQSCKPFEVVVSVYAATLNYPDLLQTVGGYQHKPSLPFTPGTEGAGVITMVGSEVTKLRIGDRVQFGGMGAMSTEVVVPAAACWRFPDDYSFSEASSFSVGYATAFHCLIERAGLKAGEVCLVHGSTGGMGLAAVQIAKCVGAVVIGTGGSDEKLVVVHKQGADHVVNYTKIPQFRDVVKSASGGQGVDVVFDPVGGSVFEETLRCVRYGCRICIVGFTSGRRPVARTNHILIKGISLLGCRAGEAVRQGQADQKSRLATLRQWAEEGKLRPYISHKYPLEEAPAAFQALWERQVVGRCIIAPHGAAEADGKAASSVLASSKL